MNISWRGAGLVLLTALILYAMPARSETLYVTDKLYLGLYPQSRDRGQQIKAITSGTRLEVLEREGRYARVRTEDGDEGWVKSQYLVGEVPALVAIRDVERELADIRNANADVAGLRDRNKALNDELQQVSERLLTAERQVVALRQEMEVRAAAAATETAALQQQLAAVEAAAQAKVREAEAQAEQEAGRASFRATAEKINLYSLYALAGGLLLGLGFFMGYKWLERRVRRRYGGYRLW